MTTLYEGAFAKINLTLDVLGKREDGYHDLQSVMQTISIRDDVEIDVERSRILKVAKQKEGRLGRWPMYFDGSRQRMSVMDMPDGQAVMRKYAAAAKARKSKDTAKRDDPIPNQVSFKEVQDDGSMPF